MKRKDQNRVRRAAECVRTQWETLEERTLLSGFVRHTHVPLNHVEVGNQTGGASHDRRATRGVQHVRDRDTIQQGRDSTVDNTAGSLAAIAKASNATGSLARKNDGGPRPVQLGDSHHMILGSNMKRQSGIEPEEFVSKIDNSYFPLLPGTTFIYQGTREGQAEQDVFFVTHDTKDILGVTTTVIRDRAFVDGQLAEETLDWFAQDDDGNVWYFGEDTKEFENGVVVSTEGSWEAGVDGARPGIIMKAHPHRGDTYRQEFAKGVAEDRATVLARRESVTVPFGTFSNCLKTKDLSRLSPGMLEHKFYAPGVGFVRSVKVRGGMEVLELVSVTRE